MSAPLNLNSSDLRDIASALERLSKIRAEFDVEAGAYGQANITHKNGEGVETVLNIEWVDEAGYYRLDDRIGN